jgi:hypothetical protein
MKITQTTRPHGSERGSAIVTVTIVLAVLLLLLAAFLRLVGAAHAEQGQERDDLQVLYVAEAGLGEAYLDVEEGRLVPEEEEAHVSGTPEEPLELGNVRYWVDAQDLGMRNYALRASALEHQARERIELVVREIPDGFFRYAVFGDEGVTIDTSAFVDSYDSSLGVYKDQYDKATGHATAFGNVGSNNDILLQTNTQIWGSATPGPDHDVTYSGPNVTVSGSTDPADDLVTLPPVVVPNIKSSGTAIVKKKTLYLGPGDVHYSSVQVSSGGTVEIRGPARVVFDDLLLTSNTTLRMVTTGGPIQIYGTGNFRMQANSHLITNTIRPHDAAIYLSSNNVDGTPKATVEFNANAQYTGLIYAPRSSIAIHAMFELYGSVMARRVALGSNSAIHYDTSLLFDDDNGAPVFGQVSWRPIGME